MWDKNCLSPYLEYCVMTLQFLISPAFYCWRKKAHGAKIIKKKYNLLKKTIPNLLGMTLTVFYPGWEKWGECIFTALPFQYISGNRVRIVERYFLSFAAAPTSPNCYSGHCCDSQLCHLAWDALPLMGLGSSIPWDWLNQFHPGNRPSMRCNRQRIKNTVMHLKYASLVFGLMFVFLFFFISFPVYYFFNDLESHF